jgi:nucleoside-diphosphate-sugar epimerase
LDKVAWLREAGVNLQAVDLRDDDLLRPLVQSHDIVYHVAAWLGDRHGDSVAAHALNVELVRKMVTWAGEANVSRFVQVSSIAVYGRPDKGIVTENRALDVHQAHLYGRTKAGGEQIGWQVAEQTSLPLTVARPGMVYGPRSESWTVKMLMRVQKRTPTILGDGLGHAHPVYIDNLVDGLVLLGWHPAAVGEAFNFVDEATSWRIFFGYYGRMSNRRLVRVPLWLVKGAIGLVKLAGKSPSQTIGMDSDLLRFYTATHEYDGTKAKELLGYEPRYSLNAGMAETEKWLKQTGYLRHE